MSEVWKGMPPTLRRMRTFCGIAAPRYPDLRLSNIHPTSVLARIKFASKFFFFEFL